MIYESQSNLKKINNVTYSKLFYQLTIYLTDLYLNYIINIKRMVEIFRNR